MREFANSIQMYYSLAVYGLMLMSVWRGAAGQDDLTVKVQQGTLRGEVVTSVLGQVYYSFRGIPYAKPPLGDLRFKDAKSPDTWKGIREATQEGCICPQFNVLTLAVEGCEDCLLLNVYTPKLPSFGSESLPVMVWIHGGGFVSGSGNFNNYGPDFFMSEDVVLVTINYRLASLGFLFMKKAAPGNVGLKDQVAALRWVKKNIAKFNGDPNKVTIFGESSGSVSVYWHMLSPMSKGLFRSAIGQSATAMSPWAVQHEPYETSLRLAMAVGCSEGGDFARLRCLRQVDYDALVRAAAQTAPTDRDQERLLNFAFVPTADEEAALGVERFAPGPPEQLLKHGCQHAVPLLTGFNDAEWMLDILGNKQLFETEEGLRNLDANWERYVIPETRLADDTSKASSAIEKLRDFFLDGNNLTFENVQGYKDMLTDLQFAEPIYYATKYLAKWKKAPLYTYSFTVDDKLNYLKYTFNLNYPGAAHADENGYLFQWSSQPPVTPGDTAFSTRQKLVRLWTNFAKEGDPTPSGDELIGKTWKPYTSGSRNFFEIGNELSAGKDLNKERVSFWEDFYGKFNAEREKGGWKWQCSFGCADFSFIACFLSLLSFD